VGRGEVVFEHDVASFRVAEKVGMRFEGHVTAYDMDELKTYLTERSG
jgi:RimJ/RimL family protein N-acetyltransferase